MMDILEDRGDLIVVRVSGKLFGADYARFVPWLERRVAEQARPLRFVVHAEDWDGWPDLRAAWADLKMDARFSSHVERVAMIGDSRWQEWLTKLSNPLLPTKMRWFGPGEAEAAEAWAANRKGTA
jgi:hypothetical protein